MHGQGGNIWPAARLWDGGGLNFVCRKWKAWPMKPLMGGMPLTGPAGGPPGAGGSR
jgi:hypothetical protein